MLSILAGVMISIGGAAYLQHNNIIGAILFSIGLITIVLFKFELFTGKAGLYAANKITKSKLIEIWFGNFLGTFITSFGIIMTPKGLEIAESAQAIL